MWPRVALAAPGVVPTCMGHGRPVPMMQVADHDRLPMPVAPGQRAELIPARVEHLHAAGYLTPETQHALDWLWRNRESNGFAPAFTMVGGRRCIDLVAFARITRSKQ